ncbi:MAG: Gfo/Idh/MocA family oxidoreductase [Phycisphaerae bacterium]|nr:Gfo/Idh/MocA family oxidoreductase [Phycisphaerae bacterium]
MTSRPSVPFDSTRRATIAAAALAPFAASSLASSIFSQPRADTLRVGVIGCGGRGTGAAVDALTAGQDVRIVALADLFQDRLDSAKNGLKEHDAARATVDDAMCFVGFDAYKEVLKADVDIVICATAPGFRPLHVAAAVNAGKHVFMEKPCAVDGHGIRMVLDAAKVADAKKLCVVAGTQRRRQVNYREAMQRIHAGDIGQIVAARCYWNQGGLWNVEPQSGRSDVENQVRNWLYHSWLSGDHIVEQHVHQLDVLCWAFRGHPMRVNGVGGRQVRTDPKFGHIFDHFGLEYIWSGAPEYGDVFALSMCRQQDGTASKVEEILSGTEGVASLRPGYARITGKKAWQFEGADPNPYVEEHRDLQDAIRTGRHVNDMVQIAESTMTAIMGRMAAYSGQEVTWEQAMASEDRLMPESIEFGERPVAPVALPGRTKL